jgi:hypothetical protein
MSTVKWWLKLKFTEQWELDVFYQNSGEGIQQIFASLHRLLKLEK